MVTFVRPAKTAELIQMLFGLDKGRCRTNPFAVTRVTKRGCSISSKFFDHLFELAVQWKNSDKNINYMSQTYTQPFYGHYTLCLKKTGPTFTLSVTEFLISQGSVVTCLRWGGYCRMCFVANFLRFPAVQKFWKLVKIWQSYIKFKSGTFFETQCIDQTRGFGWSKVLLPSCPCWCPLPSDRQHLTFGDFLEIKRVNNQNCSVLCCVWHLCRVIHTHMWTVLKFACWFRFRFRFCVFV